MALFALSQAAFYYAFKYIISSMDPLKTKKKDAHEKSAKVLDRLGVRKKSFVKHLCSEIFFVILSNNPLSLSFLPETNNVRVLSVSLFLD